MSRALNAFSGRKKPLHAPKGVIEGGQFVGKASVTHALIRKLLGLGGHHGQPDARRNLGKTKTAGGSTIAHRLPSRAPSRDDEVRDSSGRRGTVLHVNPTDKTVRVRWQNGHEETRKVDSLDWPQRGGVERDAEPPRRSEPGLATQRTAGGSVVTSRLAGGGDRPQHRGVEDVRHMRSYNAEPTAARRMDAALGGPPKRETAAARMSARVAAGRVDADTATRLLKGESATSIVDSRTPGGYRDREYANLGTTERAAVDALGTDQAELYWTRRAAGQDHGRSLKGLTPNEGTSGVTATNAGIAAFSTDPAIRAAAGAELDRPRETHVDNRIRQAYKDLQRQPGDWVSLADVRDQLADVPRAEQDASLTRLAMTPGHHVIPWDNYKALSDRERSAALRIGGADSHHIRIEEPGSGYRPTAADSPRTAAAKMARAKAPSPSTADHASALEKMTTREEGIAYVDKLKGKALTDLAAHYNLNRGTVADKRHRIVEHTIGFRLNSEAIRGGSWANTPEASAAHLLEPSRPTAAAKMARAKAPAVDTDALAARLNSFDFYNPPSREETSAQLEGLKKPELVAVAQKLGVPRASSLKMEDLRREIVDATVGRRLDSIATRGFTGLRPDSPNAPGRPTAAAKMARAKAPARLTPRSLKDGERLVWQPPGETPVVGTVVHAAAGKTTRTFVDWEGGRRERITGNDPLTNIRRVDAAELASLGIDVPAPPRTTAVAKMAKPKAPDVSGLATAIRGGGSEGEIIRLLASDAGLSSPRLREVAAGLNIDVPAGMKAKTSLQLHIAHEASRRFGAGDGNLAARAPEPSGVKAFDPSLVTDRIHELNVRDKTEANVRALLDGYNLAQIRRIATAQNVQLPAKPPNGEPRWTSGLVADYIAMRVAQDRSRWSFR